MTLNPEPSPESRENATEVSRILAKLEAGKPEAAEELLPLVYDELKKLAAACFAREKPGQTLQATALVHEAYLRLLKDDAAGLGWDSRGHFFAAAATAMRRILVEAARKKKRERHGGGLVRQELLVEEVAQIEPREDLLELEDALIKLAEHDRSAADLIQLRYFAGLSLADAAQSLGIPRRSADRRWAYARAWLHREIIEARSR